MIVIILVSCISFFILLLYVYIKRVYCNDVTIAALHNVTILYIIIIHVIITIIAQHAAYLKYVCGIYLPRMIFFQTQYCNGRSPGYRRLCWNVSEIFFPNLWLIVIIEIRYYVIIRYIILQYILVQILWTQQS